MHEQKDMTYPLCVHFMHCMEREIVIQWL